MILRPETNKYQFGRDRAYATVKDTVTINLLWEFLLKEDTLSFWWTFTTDLPDLRGGTLRNRKHTVPQEHERFGKMLVHVWRHNHLALHILFTPATEELGLMSHLKLFHHLEH